MNGSASAIACRGEFRTHWDSQGYILVRQLIAPARVARLLEISQDVIERVFVRDPITGKPHHANAVGMRQPHHPDYFRDLPDGRARKLELLELAADPRVLEVAAEILGGAPLFRSISMFFNPRIDSRDGDWHRDAQFLASNEDDERRILFDPAAKLDAIQFQLALVPNEDVEVVPASHLRWDTAEEYRIRKSDGGKHNTSDAMPGALRPALAAGDALAFDPGALHRGRYHVDRPRRTLMLTYTTDASALHDFFSMQPWFLEQGYLDGLSPATRTFYQRFIDKFRDDWKETPGKTA